LDLCFLRSAEFDYALMAPKNADIASPSPYPPVAQRRPKILGQQPPPRPAAGESSPDLRQPPGTLVNPQMGKLQQPKGRIGIFSPVSIAHMRTMVLEDAHQHLP